MWSRKKSPSTLETLSKSKDEQLLVARCLTVYWALRNGLGERLDFAQVVTPLITMLEQGELESVGQVQLSHSQRVDAFREGAHALMASTSLGGVPWGEEERARAREVLRGICLDYPRATVYSSDPAEAVGQFVARFTELAGIEDSDFGPTVLATHYPDRFVRASSLTVSGAFRTVLEIPTRKLIEKGNEFADSLLLEQLGGIRERLARPTPTDPSPLSAAAEQRMSDYFERRAASDEPPRTLYQELAAGPDNEPGSLFHEMLQILGAEGAEATWKALQQAYDLDASDANAETAPPDESAPPVRPSHFPEPRQTGVSEAEPGASDPGMEAVKAIYEGLQIDAEWSVWHERGFSWWGKDYRQRVWADTGVDDDGIVIYRLHARTDLVRDVRDTTRALQGMNAFNMLNVLSALVLDPDERRIEYAASAWIHEGNVGWMSKLFQFVVAIQAAHATAQGDLFADVIDATPDTSRHPVNGSRPDLDDMLMLNEQIVVPAGAEPSAWAGGEMLDCLGLLQGSEFTVLATGDVGGISLERPFLERTSLLQVSTTQPHPALGNGMLIRLSLPLTISEADAGQWANELNRRELNSMTGAHFFGSWVVADSTPTFVGFFPNALMFSGGLLLNILTSAGIRGRWVATDIYGDDWTRPGRMSEAHRQKEADMLGFMQRLGIDQH
jgi:hypothetical protein